MSNSRSYESAFSGETDAADAHFTPVLNDGAVILTTAYESSSPAVQQSSSPAVQQSSSPAVQQSSSPAVQQSSSPAVQHNNFDSLSQPFIQENYGVASVYTGRRDYWGNYRPATYHNISVTNDPSWQHQWPGTATVQSSGILEGGTVYDGGTLYINNGGLQSGGYVESQGTVYVNDGGMLSGGTVSCGGTLFVDNGGFVTGNQDVGGSVIVENGGILSGATAWAWDYSGYTTPTSSYLTVSSGGQVIDGQIWQGGIADFQNGAFGSDINVQVGTAIIENGAIIDDLTVAKTHPNYQGRDLRGQATIMSGAIVNGGTIYDDGLLNVQGIANNILVSRGGTSNMAGTEIVISGAIGNDGTVTDGGVVLVDGSAIFNGGTVTDNGTMQVSAGGILDGGTTISNGTTIVNGYVSGAAVWQYGSEIIGSGGTASDGTVGWGANGIAQNPGGGVLSVVDGGFASNEQIWQSGTAIFSDGGSAYDIQIQAGTAIIGSGGLISGGFANQSCEAQDGSINRGTIEVQSGGTVSNINLNPPSGNNEPNIPGYDANAAGIISLGLGGEAYLQPDAGGTVIIGGIDDNTGLNIDLTGIDPTGTTLVTTEIQHFDDVQDGFPPDNYTAPVYDPAQQVWTGGDSDGIVLSGLSRSDIVGIYGSGPDANEVPPDLQKYLTGDNAGNYAIIQTRSGGWIILHIDGIGDRGVIGRDKNGNLVFEVCYLEGTHILTPDGYKKIETLYPNDLVIIANEDGIRQGTPLKVKWIGRKRLWAKQKSELPPDEAGYPICIQKGAFDKNIPENSLWVTPEHCFLFEGKFIPARMLVNDKTIFYDYKRPNYTYYHLETDPHAVLIAEGALGESYLDTNNRTNFISILEPTEDETASLLRLPRKKILFDRTNNSQKPAAPLDTSRHFVEPIWQRLAQKAGLDITPKPLTNSLGKALRYESEIQLVGTTVLQEEKQILCNFILKKPEYQLYIFTLPPCYLFDTPILRLISRTCRPCDSIGPYVDDRRHLGVLVQKVTLITPKGIHDVNNWQRDETLKGWSNIEAADIRWTAGEAELSLPPGWSRGAELHIEIITQGPYLKTTNVHADNAEIQNFVQRRLK